MEKEKIWKNIVTVDVDTSRNDSPILIGKPPEFSETLNRELSKEEYAEILISDMATLCEGICTLIHVAEQEGLKNSVDSLKDCIKHLQDGFADASYRGLTKQK